jgi:hypothetical protein
MCRAVTTVRQGPAGPWCKGAAVQVGVGRARGGYWVERQSLEGTTAQDRSPTAVAHLTGRPCHELPSCRSPDVDGGATRFCRLGLHLLRASLF